MRHSLFLLIFLVLLLTSCGKKEVIRDSNHILVGTNAEFPPFEYINNNKIIGFDIDLVSEIAKVGGFEVEFVDLPFDALLPALESKSIDLIIAGMSVTPTRELIANFSDSYFTATQSIITKKDSVISDMKDLRGKKIGVIEGYTGEIIADTIKYIEKFTFESAPDAIVKLNSGEIDAIILDYEPGKVYVEKNKNLKLVNSDTEKENYAIAVLKSNPLLLQKVNSSLLKVKNSGKYSELIDKWFK